MNKTLLHIISLIVFTVIVGQSTTVAQEILNFNEIYELYHSADKEIAYAHLRKYQNTHPEHVSTYFLLGEISANWAKEYDPLQRYEDIVKLADEANRIYYGLALNFLNEESLKANKNYFIKYRNTDGKIELSVVQQAIKQKQKELVDYISNISKIYSLYTSSVYNYYQCVSIFKEIVYSVEKEKDIYLQDNQKLRSQLNKIEVHFDSTLYYFDLYKKAIDTFPINNYKQTYTLKPILTYRLDGISQSNFLKNTIELWDYKSWLTKVRNIKNDDIRTLFSKANELEESYKNYFKLQQNDSTLVIPELITNNFIYLTKKFDYNSTLIDYFNYRQAELEFSNMLNSSYNSPIFDVKNKLEFYLKFYAELYNRKNILENRKKKLLTSLTPANYSKYNIFFDNQYGNIESLTKTIKTNSDKNDRYYADALTNSKTLLNSYSENISPESYTSGDFSTNDSSKYKILDIEKYENSYYISGYYTNGDYTEAYVSKTDLQNKVKWKKTFKIPYKNLIQNQEIQASNKAILIKPTTMGCLVVVNVQSSGDLGTDNQNYLINLDENGVEVSEFYTMSNLVPRYLSCDALNQEIHIGFKSKNIENTDDLGQMHINCYTMSGSLIWQSTITIQGTLFHVFKQNDEYLLFFNYSKLMDNTDIITPESGKYGICSAKTGIQGKLTDFKFYDFPSGISGSYFIKYSNNQLFIIGSSDISSTIERSIKTPFLFKLDNNRNLTITTL